MSERWGNQTNYIQRSKITSYLLKSAPFLLSFVTSESGGKHRFRSHQRMDAWGTSERQTEFQIHTPKHDISNARTSEERRIGASKRSSARQRNGRAGGRASLAVGGHPAGGTPRPPGDPLMDNTSALTNKKLTRGRANRVIKDGKNPATNHGPPCQLRARAGLFKLRAGQASVVGRGDHLLRAGTRVR
jgi:hypothetical protein